jgi:hypothetical protein
MVFAQDPLLAVNPVCRADPAALQAGLTSARHDPSARTKSSRPGAAFLL